MYLNTIWQPNVFKHHLATQWVRSLGEIDHAEWFQRLHTLGAELLSSVRNLTLDDAFHWSEHQKIPQHTAVLVDESGNSAPYNRYLNANRLSLPSGIEFIASQMPRERLRIVRPDLRESSSNGPVSQRYQALMRTLADKAVDKKEIPYLQSTQWDYVEAICRENATVVDLSTDIERANNDTENGTPSLQPSGSSISDGRYTPFSSGVVTSETNHKPIKWFSPTRRMARSSSPSLSISSG